MWCCGLENKELEDSRASRVHMERRRCVDGCIACGQEVRPGEPIHVCGRCTERYTYCARCAGGEHARRHGHPMHLEHVVLEVDASPVATCTTVRAALGATLETYAPRACLGYPVAATHVDARPAHAWMTYGEVRTKAEAVGRGLQRLCVPAPGVPLATGTGAATVVLFAEATVDWYLVQFGCILAGGMIVVPVLDNTGLDHLISIVARAGARVIVASAKTLACAQKAAAAAGIAASMVVIGSPGPGELPCTVEGASGAHGIAELLRAGLARGPDAGPLDRPRARGGAGAGTLGTGALGAGAPGAGDEAVMLIPTSGSSGVPKLIIVSTAMMLRQFTPPDFGIKLVMFSYQPLRQSFDTLIKGGQIGLWSGDLARLEDDMASVRPTVFGSTPSIWQAMKQKFDHELSTALALAPAPAQEQREGAYTRLRQEWRDRQVLGNRCKMILIGGAASSAELRNWIWDVTCAVVTDGYGTSETGAISSNGQVPDVERMQLFDVPAMGYTTADKPHPRGEIVVRTGRLTPGYFNDAAATESAFVTIHGKRFFRTGDIGQLVNGEVTVVDRCSAMFKLAQGVFVAPSPLEAEFAKSILVSQVLVCGSPHERTVCAVVVLSDKGHEVCDRGGTLGLDTAPLQKDLAELARSSGKRPFEVPRRVLVDLEPWSEENGLMTPSAKICRSALVRKHAPFIHSSGGGGAGAGAGAGADAPGAALTAGAVVQPARGGGDGHDELCAGLVDVVMRTIPAAVPADIRSGTSLYELGADSLATAHFVAAIQQQFGVAIPAAQVCVLPTLGHVQAVIFGAHYDADVIRQGIADEVKVQTRNLCDSMARAFDARVPGKGGAVWQPRGKRGEETVVVLSGATGFVGAYLFKELLRTRRDRIVCLVRASSDAHARERMAAVMKFWRFDAPDARWTAVKADMTADRFGLGSGAYADLASCTVAVFHAAAIVNASLPFRTLVDANVAGTVRAVRLCFDAGAQLHHMSTLSLLDASRDGPIKEALTPSPPLLSSGYAQSKWAAEQVVKAAAEGKGLCARVYRLGTMAADEASGACNPNCTFTRVVCGVAHLGAVSTGDGGDEVLPAAFSLTPISWAARAVCTIAARPFAKVPHGRQRPPPTVYHITTHFRFPMDALAPALRVAGYPVRGVAGAVFRRMIESAGTTSPLFALPGVAGSARAPAAPAAPAAAQGNPPRVAIDDANTAKHHTRCPRFAEASLARMIKFLGSAGLIPIHACPTAMAPVVKLAAGAVRLDAAGVASVQSAAYALGPHPGDAPPRHLVSTV